MPLRVSAAVIAFAFLASTRLFAAEPELLQRAAANAESVYSELKSFVCDEKIDRFAGSSRGTRQWTIDSITTSLSLENGVEHYDNIRQDNQPRSDLATVAGAWSQGEFGTLLHQTTQLMTTQTVNWERSDELDGQAVSVYCFDIADVASPWQLVVESPTYPLAFHTEFWVSAAGQVLRITRSASNIPRITRIAFISWTVSLQPLNLNGAEWLVPATADYAVVYSGKDRREWNRISFSNYRRYGSQVALRFDRP